MAPHSQPFPLPENFPPTDTLFFPATANRAEDATTTVSTLVFFLPGNPGLVDYYTAFLSQLSALNPQLTVLGASHAGFSPDHPPVLHAGWAWKWGAPPWGLDAQVAMKKELLLHAVAHVCPRRVVLVAHSMGAFLALELLSQLNHSQQQQQQPPPQVEVAGGIMLFPTAMEIAQSPQGQLMAPFLASRAVRTIAWWASGALSLLAALLSPLLPPSYRHSFLDVVVRLVTAQTPHAATVTRRFACAPHAVEQALALAAEEMVAIAADRWADEVWNAGGSLPLPKEDGGGRGRGGMLFVFGQKDRWVAEETRQAIMAKPRGGARMIVEERGLPHNFCIHHGEEVAELCTDWLADILG